MSVEFKTDINELRPPNHVKFNLVGTKLPNNNDIFYRAKQKELIEQYSGARLFLYETETEDWAHWYKKPDNETVNEAFKIIYSAYFYEAALFFYNAIVDLSWTLTYVAAEFSCAQKGSRVDISGMKPIDEAATLLRAVEKSVTSPTAEDNPFGYLKSMCPEFSDAIDKIIGFWNQFGPTDIRKKYNFCKHKGKPGYTELLALDNTKLMGVYFKDKESENMVEIASDTKDVKYKFSLEEGIEELRRFDDEVLFPYIRDLMNELERILQPSPMMF